MLLTGLVGSVPPLSRAALARRRVAALARGTPVGRTDEPGRQSTRGARTAGAIAAVACLVMLPLPVSVAAATGVAVAVPLIVGRLEPATSRREARRLAAEFPLVADLFAALVLGGAAPTQAVRVISEAFGGPIARRLERVAAALELGIPAQEAWAALATDPVLGSWASAMARTARSGAPVAGVVASLADGARAQQAAAAQQASRQAEVWSVLPLGLCFLPAFVLLGVVPLVGSLASDVLAPLS
jgi:hypothetical protein